MKFKPYLEHIIAKVLEYAVNQNNYLTVIKISWWEVYSLQPPLNLIKYLSKLKEHWNIIALQWLLQSPQRQLDYLINFFQELQLTSPESSLSWNEFYNFLKYFTEILNALPYEYYHITCVLFNDLLNAKKILEEKLNPDITPNDELSIDSLNNLNVLNNDDSFQVENILLNILKEVDTFCCNFYQMNGYTRSLSENKINYGLLSKSMPYYTKIEDYCHKLSDIVEVMLRIKTLTAEQILESRIVINEFLTAIVRFDEVNLNTKNVINYVLMKDKNLFLNILLFFQNNLAALENLITTIFKF